MGGLGSGRWHGYQTVKATTEDLLRADSRVWHRMGLLVPGETFPWHWKREDRVISTMGVEVLPGEDGRAGGVVWMFSRPNSDEERHPVGIHWRDTLGTKDRPPWPVFVCPRCDGKRKPALLYLGKQGPGCRECLGLVHVSQRLTRYDRAFRAVGRTRQRLGWDTPENRMLRLKPKHMHWKTFAKLVAELERQERKAMEPAVAVLARFKKRAGIG